MCGIFGIYGQYKFDYCKKNINSILSTLNKRGPDKNDIFIDNDLSLLLGHTRLSILELSNYGSQPRISKSGDLIIGINYLLINLFFDILILI